MTSARSGRPSAAQGTGHAGPRRIWPEPVSEPMPGRPRYGWVSPFPSSGGFYILVQSESLGSSFYLEDERKMAGAGSAHVSFWTEDQGVAMAVALRYCRENDAKFEVVFDERIG